MLHFEGTRDFARPPAEVWARLTDARFLVKCLPGVESVKQADADGADDRPPSQPGRQSSQAASVGRKWIARGWHPSCYDPDGKESQVGRISNPSGPDGLEIRPTIFVAGVIAINRRRSGEGRVFEA